VSKRTSTPPHWADVLNLRNEVRATDGSVGELQMSLSKAVYQTVPVPYAKCDYFTDITEPTPKLVGFLARVARRLGVQGLDTQACFHLHQGMGGGKSHALVGLWHMINTPDAFFDSDLGQAVKSEAGAAGHSLDLSGVLPVVLTCDGFSPGKTDARFGPATDLFGRFLWAIFADRDDQMDRYQQYMGQGANKATLQAVFEEVGRPVLVLVDELMDYVMALTDQTQIGGMPGEEAFLNALTDAVDDQPNVALVLVMINSEEDQAGYHPQAEALRDYLTPRLQRNGSTVTVTEPADFAQIIRRRLFERADVSSAAADLAEELVQAATEQTWFEKVFSSLGAERGPANLSDRIAETYPFHPDLYSLVSKEWTVVQAFQRVRSTVSIFARTVLHWVNEHEHGRWAPPLIGTGDLPLQTDALEALLSSGVLAGNDRAIQGYRAVANGDIINTGGGGGTAYSLDTSLSAAGVDAKQPNPAVRMATACFSYSLVPRPRGPRGATKAEMLAAIALPGLAFSTAEEVFNALVASPNEGGLGALERRKAGSGRGADYYHLSIKQTLTMYHSNALTMVSAEEAGERVWTTAQQLADKGTFSALQKVSQPADPSLKLPEVFDGIDSQQTRLVVLDPRRWTLLNGRDRATKADLDVLFGVTAGLTSQYSASLVVAVVNTQRRDRARGFAKDLLAWEHVVSQLNQDDEEYPEANSRLAEAKVKLDDAVRKAYQHFAYLLRTTSGLAVQYKQVPDTQSSLSGRNVWAGLVAESRAVELGELNSTYVAELVSGFDRNLTPKELFSQPYTDPSWPMVASDEDLRRVLFELATGDDWMLLDSEGEEIRPETLGQIQPATMQQTLQRRPASSPVEVITPDGDWDAGGTSTTVLPGALESPGEGGQAGPSDGGTPVADSYDRTRITIDYTSVTDPNRRNQLWQFFREIASLLDAVRQRDVQMLGVAIEISARSGDADAVVNKANEIEGARTETQADDF
jgi:hypothetical protein